MERLSESELLRFARGLTRQMPCRHSTPGHIFSVKREKQIPLTSKVDQLFELIRKGKIPHGNTKCDAIRVLES
jgi:hypothetical protein